ncbi:hypothetical protein Nepgr_007642 [Nepenthes gracilis]|uniref:Uncharacterized protein n=1 Tax=Nepenthes gracilis TaxID=150966 RepID=A0AAD3XIG1_NEPGR|nr:hypothetical protein Nepgr_007642 [Nepenthes gracilis]
MELGDLNKVWETKALKKPGQEEAKKILERIAKQVQPIMRKHKWRVKVLSEFCPNNHHLLGLNVGGGVHVKLRLRRPNRDWDFFPFDQILDTMLHELCHNVHGPHNASFYQLWDELRKECEELITNGISGTGVGFDLHGRRVGGFSRQPPLSSLRQTALAAAEKRRQLGSLLPPGPKRLGGDKNIMNALNPVQAAAMAAERRLHDEIWCGSGSHEMSAEEESCCDSLERLPHVGCSAASSIVCNGTNKQPFPTMSRKRSRESEGKLSPKGHDTNFVDLSSDKDDLRFRKRSSESTTSSSSHSSYITRKSNLMDLSPTIATSTTFLDHCMASNGKESVMWQCETCTLLNPPLALVCEICSNPKPRDASLKYKIWSCKFCTLENSVELDKCYACWQWRYSTGPPASTRAPNLGT